MSSNAASRILNPAELVRESRSPQIPFVQTHALKLEDWLYVDWFYPDWLSERKIIVGKHSILIDSQECHYKFIRETTVPEVADRWRLAIEEVIDHRLYAKGFYLGLRGVTWRDGEPVWSELIDADDVVELSTTCPFDDVAIVRKALPRNHSLLSILESKSLSEEFIGQRVGKALGGIHRGSGLYSNVTPVRDCSSYLRNLSSSLIDDMENRLLTYSMSTTPIHSIAFHEVKAFLARFIERNEEALRKRFRTGSVGDIHGAIEAEEVFLPVECLGKNSSQFIGRALRRSTRRQSDALWDVACLQTQLLHRGYRGAAGSFLESYQLESGRADAELLRFFSAAAASFRARSELAAGLYSSLHQIHSGYLGLALQFALGVANQFGVIFSGGKAAREHLSLAFSSIFSCKVFSLDGEEDLAVAPVPDELQIYHLLSRAEAALRQGHSVIVSVPSIVEEARSGFQAFLDRQSATGLVVKCAGKHWPESRPLDPRSCLAEIAGIALPPGPAVLEIAADDITPELVMFICRQLAMNSSRSRPARAEHMATKMVANKISI